MSWRGVLRKRRDPRRHAFLDLTNMSRNGAEAGLLKHVPKINKDHGLTKLGGNLLTQSFARTGRVSLVYFCKGQASS